MASELVIGRKAIAHEIGCCERTVTRLYRAGKLPKAFKLGETSPLKISAKDLRKLRQGKGR